MVLCLLSFCCYPTSSTNHCWCFSECVPIWVWCPRKAVILTSMQGIPSLEPWMTRWLPGEPITPPRQATVCRTSECPARTAACQMVPTATDPSTRLIASKTFPFWSSRLIFTRQILLKPSLSVMFCLIIWPLPYIHWPWGSNQNNLVFWFWSC